MGATRFYLVSTHLQHIPLPIIETQVLQPNLLQLHKQQQYYSGPEKSQCSIIPWPRTLHQICGQMDANQPPVAHLNQNIAPNLQVMGELPIDSRNASLRHPL